MAFNWNEYKPIVELKRVKQDKEFMIPSFHSSKNNPPPIEQCAGCYAAGIFVRSVSAGILGGRYMAFSGLLAGSVYAALQRNSFSDIKHITPMQSLTNAAFAWTASIGTMKLAGKLLKIEGAFPLRRASAIGGIVEISGFLLKDLIFLDLRSCEEKASERIAFNQLREYLLSRLDS